MSIGPSRVYVTENMIFTDFENMKFDILIPHFIIFNVLQ